MERDNLKVEFEILDVYCDNCDVWLVSPAITDLEKRRSILSGHAANTFSIIHRGHNMAVCAKIVSPPEYAIDGQEMILRFEPQTIH